MKTSMLENRKTNPKIDYFEQLPDEILLHIIDLVSNDINALFRLRTLSRRFNSLVIDKTKHLFLQADTFDRIFDTDLGSYRSRYSSKPTTNFPNRVVFLRCFKHVTKLVIELPAYYTDYMNPSTEHEVKCMYKATFGKNLKNSCVILCYSTGCYCDASCPLHDFLWRKEDVMRYLLKKCASIAMNVVPHLENLVSLVVRDSEGDLEMVMDNEDIREESDAYEDEDTREESDTYEDARVVMPAAWYSSTWRWNKVRFINIGGGFRQGNMVLVVVAEPHYKKIDDVEEADLVKRAFGSGLYGMAVEKLLHGSPYILHYGPSEMFT